ncbi:MAG: hypothetical protein AB7K04_04055 [Pseudorhodoplanes sp.]
MSGWISPSSLRFAAGFLTAFMLAALAAAPAPAQMNATQPTAQLPPQTNTITGSPGTSLVAPGGYAPSPSGAGAPRALNAQPLLDLPVGQAPLSLAARLGPNQPLITHGLQWRIYADRPDPSGAFRLVKEDKNATPTLTLPPGGYVVHVSFGLASASRAVQVRSDGAREMFDLPAGGLTIKGQVGDVRIPNGQISFDVYRGSQFELGDRRPVAQGVQPGDVVLLPDGTYYIVSNYGDGNAVVRSDIRVQTGKLTDVTVTHRAAVITLKLVSEKGGEALANTAFTVLTPGGDVIKESLGAFARVVLAEGDYRAIARNEGKVSDREFKVITGVDSEVEVVAR